MTEAQPPSYESATQNIINELAREVRPDKSMLSLRKIKKVKERDGLIFKTNQQKEKIRKMMIELRTSESQFNAVENELKEIERELDVP